MAEGNGQSGSAQLLPKILLSLSPREGASIRVNEFNFLSALEQLRVQSPQSRDRVGPAFKVRATSGNRCGCRRVIPCTNEVVNL
jgi:hypothetical protein